VCTILQRAILLDVNYLSFASVFFMVGVFALQGKQLSFIRQPSQRFTYLFSHPPDKMHFRKAFFAGILIVGGVLAGPGGYVTIINATPYNFQLTYSHEHPRRHRTIHGRRRRYLQTVHLNQPTYRVDATHFPDHWL
jgi:hypothetical protein